MRHTPQSVSIEHRPTILPDGTISYRCGEYRYTVAPDRGDRCVSCGAAMPSASPREGENANARIISAAPALLAAEEEA